MLRMKNRNSGKKARDRDIRLRRKRDYERRRHIIFNEVGKKIECVTEGNVFLKSLFKELYESDAFSEKLDSFSGQTCSISKMAFKREIEKINSIVESSTERDDENLSVHNLKSRLINNISEMKANAKSDDRGHSSLLTYVYKIFDLVHEQLIEEYEAEHSGSEAELTTAQGESESSGTNASDNSSPKRVIEFYVGIGGGGSEVVTEGEKPLTVAQEEEARLLLLRLEYSTTHNMVRLMGHDVRSSRGHSSSDGIQARSHRNSIASSRVVLPSIASADNNSTTTTTTTTTADVSDVESASASSISASSVSVSSSGISI